MYRCAWIAVLAWLITGPAERVVLADSPIPAESEASKSVSAPASKLDQVQQLLEAARHLDAANDVELARQARRKAGQLLLEESDRLTQEQRRYESLSLALDSSPITVQVLIAESPHLPRDEMMRVIREAGGTPAGSDSFDAASPGIAAILGPSIAGHDLVRALTRVDSGLVIVSRPQVQSLDGTPAQIQVGESRRIIQGVHLSDQNTPVPDYVVDEVGIRISITPTLASENCIQLDLSAEKSEFVEQEVPLFTDPASGKTITSPIKNIASAQTTATVPDGRVLFLALDLQTSAEKTASDDRDSRRMLLLLLQPKIGDD